MSDNAAGAAGRRTGEGRKSRPDAGTGFLGVSRRPGGKFAARISDSNGQSQAWLGTFDTAEQAARAFDAAAVKIHGAAAITNFEQPVPVDDDGGGCSLLHVQDEPSGGQGSATHFWGVSRLLGGKFGAKIKDSKKSYKWLGTFDTAEDAARAFDAAAVKIRGPATRTNFKLAAAMDDCGVSSLMHVPAEQASNDVQTKFRGVSRQRSGKFGSKIRESKESQKWLGTFDNAEDAARAFDAAAVKIRGPAAITNFKHPGGVSSLLHVPAEPSCSQDAGTHFRGVSKLPSGYFGARIRDGKTQNWIGTFDTAEDAARAFDAAAVKIRGPAAITNFKQPVAIDDGGVSSLLRFPAKPSGQGVHRQRSGEYSGQICDSKGKAVLSPGGIGIPGMRHGDLSTDLAPWQQVAEFLEDTVSADDTKALIEAAVILRQISVAGHGDHGGRREVWRTSINDDQNDAANW